MSTEYTHITSITIDLLKSNCILEGEDALVFSMRSDDIINGFPSQSLLNRPIK